MEEEQSLKDMIGEVLMNQKNMEKKFKVMEKNVDEVKKNVDEVKNEMKKNIDEMKNEMKKNVNEVKKNIDEMDKRVEKKLDLAINLLDDVYEIIMRKELRSSYGTQFVQELNVADYSRRET